MPLHKDVPAHLQDLALWLLPGHNQRRINLLRQASLNAGTAADSPALLQQVAQHPCFRPEVRQLAALALQDPWRLPFSNQLNQHLRWAEAPDHWLLPLAELPPLLQAIVDPPVLLCVRGCPKELQAPAVAVVGSRNLSPEGRHLAQHWSAHLAWQGLNVISGLARGVDGFAHQGVLDARQQGASGTTLAVLAHGLDQVYPPEHRGMAERIVAQGALLSEYPLGTAPLARQFPARNRIVTGLALGVLVVEAQLKSGSLISARHAMEQGREVMAIPGSVRRPQSAGCHQLIRDGAALVSHPDEVLMELHQPLRQQLQGDDQPQAALAAGLPEYLQPLYALVTDVPQPADLLLQQLHLNAAEGVALLQELALEGLIEQQPGGWCRSA